MSNNSILYLTNFGVVNQNEQGLICFDFIHINNKSE